MGARLDADDGRRFGFELTFFRFALLPDIPESDSAWRTNQVYIAHFAVTDADREAFYVAERFSRGALGLAGASAEPFRVWIDDWQIAAEPGTDTWQLKAGDDDIKIHHATLNLLGQLFHAHQVRTCGLGLLGSITLGEYRHAHRLAGAVRQDRGTTHVLV